MGELGSHTFGPNPKIGEHAAKGSKSVSGIGKFVRDLKINKFSRKSIEEYDPKLLPLYDWYNALDKRGIDYLLELKNVYAVLQGAMLPSLIDKISHGESLSKRDIDALRLIKDTLVESHKLKYGDKKVIEHVVSVADIRKQMRSDKKIIDVEAIKNEPVSQDMDRSGRGEGYKQEDRENSGDNDSPKEA